MTSTFGLTYNKVSSPGLITGWLHRLPEWVSFGIMRFAALVSESYRSGGYSGLNALFLHLMKQYDPIIRRVAFSYSVTREEFDDLRQEILLNIWKGLPGFREDSKPSTWIWRVALNTCVSTLRSRKRSIPTSSDEALLRSVAADNEDEERLEQLNQLHKAITRLSLDDKAIITLRLDEKSYEEIAELMGMNRNTIATRLRRIREKLSQEIKSNN